MKEKKMRSEADGFEMHTCIDKTVEKKERKTKTKKNTTHSKREPGRANSP